MIATIQPTAAAELIAGIVGTIAITIWIGATLANAWFGKDTDENH